MKELQDIRRELDAVDTDIVRLFEKRMELSREVAAYKLAHEMPVLDDSREKAVLLSRTAMLKDSCWTESLHELFTCILALSRAEQERCQKEAHRHD